MDWQCWKEIRRISVVCPSPQPTRPSLTTGPKAKWTSRTHLSCRTPRLNLDVAVRVPYDRKATCTHAPVLLVLVVLRITPRTQRESAAVSESTSSSSSIVVGFALATWRTMLCQLASPRHRQLGSHLQLGVQCYVILLSSEYTGLVGVQCYVILLSSEYTGLVGVQCYVIVLSSEYTGLGLNRTPNQRLEEMF